MRRKKDTGRLSEQDPSTQKLPAPDTDPYPELTTYVRAQKQAQAAHDHSKFYVPPLTPVDIQNMSIAEYEEHLNKLGIQGTQQLKQDHIKYSTGGNHDRPVKASTWDLPSKGERGAKLSETLNHRMDKLEALVTAIRADIFQQMEIIREHVHDHSIHLGEMSDNHKAVIDTVDKLGEELATQVEGLWSDVHDLWDELKDTDEDDHRSSER